MFGAQFIDVSCMFLDLFLGWCHPCRLFSGNVVAILSSQAKAIFIVCHSKAQLAFAILCSRIVV